MKKMLVTGGAGFIGSHTCVELAAAGFEPVIVDDLRNSEERALEGIARIIGRGPTVYPIECCDANAMELMFAAEGPIHGAIHFPADKAVGYPTRVALDTKGEPVRFLRIVDGATWWGEKEWLLGGLSVHTGVSRESSPGAS